MLQLLAFRNRFALRRIDASVLEIARAALLDARIEVRESAKGLIASVRRGQLGVAQLRAEFRHTGALERRHSAARRCARLSRTTF
jgi:predicted nucleotidyltransferase